MSAAHLRGSRGLAPETPRRSEGWVPFKERSSYPGRQAGEGQDQLAITSVVRY
jgi:hypothetical protein